MPIKNIVSLVKEYPPFRPKRKSTSSRKPIHSWETCLHLYIDGCFRFNVQRYSECRVRSLNLPWNEPYPDHKWISRTFKKIPWIYFERVLTWSAYLCSKESGCRKGIIASNSRGVETDGYNYEIRLLKSKMKFEKLCVKQYLKWHVMSQLSLII